jgi:hypothetical protein
MSSITESKKRKSAGSKKRKSVPIKSRGGAKAKKTQPGQTASGRAKSNEVQSNPKKLTIQWFSYSLTTAVKDMELEDESKWSEWLLAKYDLQVLAEFQEAVASFNDGAFTRVPKSVVDRWRDVGFARDKQYAPVEVAFEELILWGSKFEMLRQDGSLKQLEFDKVREDLCELKDVQHGMAINYRRRAAPAAAAAAAADVNMAD